MSMLIWHLIGTDIATPPVETVGVHVAGDNAYGQLGLGDTVNRNRMILTLPDEPINYDFSNNFVSWGAYSSYHQRLLDDRILYVAGRATNGALGNGTVTPNLLTFTANEDISPDFVNLSFGMNQRAGAFYAQIPGSVIGVGVPQRFFAGLNTSGQLGDGTFTERDSFTQDGVGTIYFIDCNQDTDIAFCIGLRSDDFGETVYLVEWGNLNDLSGGSNTVPQQVGAADNWEWASCGGHHAAAINRISGAQELWLYGQNNYGQLGLGDTTERLTLTQAPGTGWRKVSCGQFHTVAVRNEEGVNHCYVAGRNEQGQLGLGDFDDRDSFTELASPDAYEIIDAWAGKNHTVIRTQGNVFSEGGIYVFGRGTEGQLALGDFNSHNTPQFLCFNSSEGKSRYVRGVGWNNSSIFVTG